LLDKESQRSVTRPRFTGEKWEGWLKVRDEGLYNFRLQSWGGEATLHVDGQEMANCIPAENSPCEASADLFLTEGYHYLDINYSYLDGAWAGVRLTWTLRPFDEVYPEQSRRAQGRFRSGQALQGGEQGMLPMDCLRPYGVDVE
jgi:hypothetical protein